MSQKGPFVKGTSVKVYELENGRNLSPKGTAFPTEITSDAGNFKLSNLKLKSQFVFLEADGFYRNEVTGKVSTARITLRAVSDLTKMKTINVNLLTHLEFFRAEYLVVNKGLRVSKAKIQADKEIFKNFFIDASEFKAAEKLSVVGSSDEDAALLALSVIFQGGFTEGQLTDAINTFKNEIMSEDKGEWKNDSLKTVLADWVADEEFRDHFASIRKNVENWGLGKPGNFEKYLTNFWLNMYGMDPCTSTNDGKITWTENKYSKNKKESLARFICKEGKWELASDIEKDTEDWEPGTNGKVRNGNVNSDSVYVFDGSAWRKGNVLDSALGIGACYTNSNRDLKKSAADGNWYLCDLDSASWVETHKLNSYFARFTPDDKLGFLNDNVTDILNDTIIDARDGHVYRTVKVVYEHVLTGVQDSLVWMAENLNYEPKSTDSAYGQSWCYGDLDYNCEIAGRLYSWVGAMNMESKYLNITVNATYYVDGDGTVKATATEVVNGEEKVVEGVVDNLWHHQGICPEGWVLPNEDMVYQLLFYLDADNKNMGVFKTAFTGVWNGADNSYGLSFIPSGYRDAEKASYAGAGTKTYIWFSGNDSGVGTAFILSDASEYHDYDDVFSKRNGAAVRCVKDRTYKGE